jgi:hypothetical protein
MSGTKFEELLAKNARELEHEQEEWLQRKRESIWLEINSVAAPKLAKPAALGQPVFHEEVEPPPKKAGTPIISPVLTVLAVIMVAGALTALFVGMAPRKTFVMQLQGDPPASFVNMNSSWDTKRRAQELQLAQAYWMVAINDLQHKYAFNAPLPPDPPPEFKIAQSNLKDDEPTRERYWAEMRTVWSSPDDWQKVVTSDSGPVGSVIDWVRLRFPSAEKTPATAPE